MGKGKIAYMSDEPDDGRVVKLRFVAHILDTDIDSLRSRMFRDSEGRMILELDVEEGVKLKNRYKGNLPKVGGVELRESGLERTIEQEIIEDQPLLVRQIDTLSNNPIELIACLDDPQKADEASERLIRIGRNAVYLLIEQLENPGRIGRAKEILIGIGTEAVARLVWELGKPGIGDSVKEILLKISEKDARTVTRLCLNATQPMQIECAKDILLNIASRDGSIVTRNCIWALGNPKKIDTTGILLKIALKCPDLVAKYMLMILRDPRTREICKRFLMDLANIKPGICGLLDKWKDTDGFDRKAMIDDIKTAATAALERRASEKNGIAMLSRTTTVQPERLRRMS